MSIRGEKSTWSPLETPLKLQHFVWAEAPRPDILTSLLPAKDGQVPVDTSSARLWACGSPGILIASLDVSTGSLSKYSIPNPTYPPRYFQREEKSEKKRKDATTLMAGLADTKAVSMVCVGGTQLWVGTEGHSLHVLDVPGFFTHHVAVMRDAVLCLATGEYHIQDGEQAEDENRRTPTQSSSGTSAADTDNSAPNTQYEVHGTARGGLHWTKMTTGGSSDAKATVRYVLAGLANGHIVKFSSLSEEGGDMEAPFQEAPTMLRLGGSPVKAIVIAADGLAWCGVGTEIVVLQVETLREVTRFDAQPDKAYSSHRRSLVSHLVYSTLGIWSACWHTNSVQLWDTKTFSRRTSILSLAHDERARWVQSSADVSAMAVTQGILTIGTEGGSLLLFDIVPSDSLTSGSAFRPRFLGTEDICSGNIHCIVPMETKLDLAAADDAYDPEADDPDCPMRIMTCCAARFDQRRADSTGSTGKGIRSRLRASRSGEDENETKKVEISCWEFRSAQDHDRHQRLRIHNQLMSGATHKPFKFPKLTLVRVCPTAVVTTPLGD
eukprot:scpid65089/ scgid4017/ Rho guanine nucleotide exchange factor 10-like protein; GrinchGEF